MPNGDVAAFLKLLTGHRSAKGKDVDLFFPKTRTMRVLLSLSALSLALSLSAQTDQGDWIVGGTLSFNTTDNVNAFAFTPSVGMFLVRNLALGGNLGISTREVGNLRTTQWNLGPFVRYYIGSWNYRPFLVAGAGYLSETQSGKPRENGFQYAAGAGLAMFLNEAVALEIVGEYNSNKLKDRDASDGFRFLLGFQVYIDRFRMGRVTGK